MSLGLDESGNNCLPRVVSDLDPPGRLPSKPIIDLVHMLYCIPSFDMFSIHSMVYKLIIIHYKLYTGAPSNINNYVPGNIAPGQRNGE